MEINQIRKHILELTSESEYGSWEFWSTGENKTQAECSQIVQTLIDLVKEKKIFPVEHRSIVDQSYKEVSLDVARLGNEVKRSMTNDVNPDHFYWFVATEEGKKEGQELRN